jgi:hypothetical protein
MVIAGVRDRRARASAYGAASNSTDQSGLISRHPGAAGKKKPNGCQSQVLVLLHLQPPETKNLIVEHCGQSSTRLENCQGNFLDSVPLLWHFEDRQSGLFLIRSAGRARRQESSNWAEGLDYWQPVIFKGTGGSDHVSHGTKRSLCDQTHSSVGRLLVRLNRSFRSGDRCGLRNHGRRASEKWAGHEP